MSLRPLKNRLSRLIKQGPLIGRGPALGAIQAATNEAEAKAAFDAWKKAQGEHHEVHTSTPEPPKGAFRTLRARVSAKIDAQEVSVTIPADVAETIGSSQWTFTRDEISGRSCRIRWSTVGPRNDKQPSLIVQIIY